MKIKDIKLVEALNSPYKWRWSHTASGEEGFWIAKSILPDKRVLKILFQPGHNNLELWEITFAVDNSTETTGKGDQFKIFATVVDVIQDWWGKNKDNPQGTKPRWINFTASKLDDDGRPNPSRGRERLYKRFAQQFAKQLNARLGIEDEHDQVVYKILPAKKRRSRQAIEEGMIESAGNDTERHEFIIPRKFDEFLVVFTKEPSGNPNIDKMYYDMEGYDIDDKGRRTKSFDGRYSKSFKDEAAWRRAIARIKKKSINEDGQIVQGVNTTADVKPGETQRQAKKFGNKLNKKGEPPLLHPSAAKNSSPHVLSNIGLAEGILKDESQMNEYFEYPIAPRDDWYGDLQYKEQGAKIVKMSPDAYLKKVRPLSLDDESLENIDILAQHMKDGGTLDPLKLYPGGREDGRHRAYAAKKLGIKKVPVIVWPQDINELDQISTNESTQLNELFDKVYDWEWQQKSDDTWMAHFKPKAKIAYNSILVQFNSMSKGSPNYKVDFQSPMSGFDKAGGGDEFATFSTVIPIIEAFMLENKTAESLQFQAKREGKALQSKDIKNNRAELYKRMLSRFAKKHNFEFAWGDVGRMTEFILRRDVMQEANITKPSPADTLGVKRTAMPQVHKNHYPELIQYLKDHGGKFKVGKINAKSLKPVQSEFSDEGVEKMIQQMRDQKGSNFDKPLIVSSDNYIIDGHHRWLAAWNENLEVAIMQISIPVRKLLQLVRDFPKTTYKDIYEEQADLQVEEDYQYETDVDHIEKRALKAAELCRKIGNKPIMYRSFKTERNRSRLNLITKVTNTGKIDAIKKKTNDAQGEILRHLGMEHPIFATVIPPAGLHDKFGKVNILVPIDSKIIYSPEVEDLGSLEKGVDVNEIVSTYKAGWPPKNFKNEIIVDTNIYYLIDLEQFISKYIGKKNKDIINTEQFSRFRNLEQQAYSMKFKTYDDIAWYLENTVIKYIAWIKKN